MPQSGVFGVQRRVVLGGPFDCFLGCRVGEVHLGSVAHRLDGCARALELLFPPLDGVGGWRERVVVLDELAVVHEVLTQVDNLLDPVPEFQRLLGVVDAAHVAGCHPYGRSLDGIDRDHTGRLARPLGLDLGAGREEIVDQMHRRGMDTGGRKSVISRPTVTQSKAPGFARM